MFYFLVERALLKMLGWGAADFSCRDSSILCLASHMVSLEITQLSKKKKKPVLNSAAESADSM